MVSIRWCLNVRNGIELIESSENMKRSYLDMAEESLNMIEKNKESRIWTASTSYYTMYYSLYALMMKIGVKCEIHSCTIEFMRKFLTEFYSEADVKLIQAAFDLRNDLQYYPGRFTDLKKLDIVRKEAIEFYIKTKEILIKINESQIKEVRVKIKEAKNEK